MMSFHLMLVTFYEINQFLCLLLQLFFRGRRIGSITKYFLCPLDATEHESLTYRLTSEGVAVEREAGQTWMALP